MVRQGQTKRAPIERLADVMTAYFVPVITALALSTWVIWLGLGLGGALPEHFLDNSVGGWRTSLFSQSFNEFLILPRCQYGSGVVSRIRYCGICHCVSLWDWSSGSYRTARWLGPCCEIWYSRSGGVAKRFRKPLRSTLLCSIRPERLQKVGIHKSPT